MILGTQIKNEDSNFKEESWTRFNFYHFKSNLPLKTSIEGWLLGLPPQTHCFSGSQQPLNLQFQRRKIDLFDYRCPNYFSRLAHDNTKFTPLYLQYFEFICNFSGPGRNSRWVMFFSIVFHKFCGSVTRSKEHLHDFLDPWPWLEGGEGGGSLPEKWGIWTKNKASWLLVNLSLTFSEIVLKRKFICCILAQVQNLGKI